MVRRYGMMILMGLVLLALSAPAVAADDPNEADNPPTGGDGIAMSTAVALGGVCLAAGLTAVGGGFGIARVGSSCIEAIARQPEAAAAMFGPMIIAAAMIEGAMLFGIVVCLLGILGL